MGYRPRIDNYVVTDPKLSLVKKIFYKKFKMKVKCVFEIIKGRRVHRVNLENGTNLRLDIYPKGKIPKKEFLYQKLAYEKGVHVAKIIGVFGVGYETWKVSEWIEGVRIGDVWNLSKMFEKCGEQVASLNLIKDNESDYYLGLRDFTKINLIWTEKEEVYIIDFDVRPRLSVDINVVDRVIVRILKQKSRVDAFLKGYKKFRNIDKIIEILEEDDWKQKAYLYRKEDTSEDVLI